MPPTEPVRPVPFDANLRRLEGKKGLVIGIANENSIAYGCARAFRSIGAELAITYLNDKAKPYVEPLAGALEAPIVMPLDVQVEGQLEAVFEEIERRWGRLDFALHSIAFAPRADLHGRVVDCSREGFLLAMDVSCHSFIRMARLAEPLMKNGGALFTMSYFGAERVVENYNLMGPVKAALVRAPADLGAAAVWLYLEGEIGCAIFIAIWSIAAGLVTDNVLRPYLISRGSDLPLILILFGVVGGAVRFGILGLFLGPTLLAVGYELIREWNASKSTTSS
jgi:NAD(P)-dependent dehydrogenase (short-subunit alcohol dehydrogenase family)